MKKIWLLQSLLLLIIIAGCGAAPAAATSTPIQAMDTLTTQPSNAPSLQPTSIPTNTAIPPSVTPTPTTDPYSFEPAVLSVRDGTPPVQPAEPITIENFDQLFELTRWGDGRINEFQYLPDGFLMFVQTSIGVIAYHTGTLDEIWRVEFEAGLSAMAVAKNGEYLAVGTYDGWIYTLTQNEGVVIDSWQGHDLSIESIAVSLEGEKILSATHRSKLAKLWIMQEGHQIESEAITHDSEIIKEVRFFDTHLARLTIDFEHHFYDLDLQSWTDIPPKWFTTIYSPDNKIYYYYGFDVFLVETDEKLISLQLPDRVYDNRYETAKVFSNTGEYIAIGDVELIEVYRIEDGALIFSSDGLETNTGPKNYFAKPALSSGPGPYTIVSLDVSADDTMIVAVDGFGRISVWDITTGQIILQLNETDGPSIPDYIHSEISPNSHFTPDMNLVVSIGSGHLNIYKLVNGERTHEWAANWQNQPLIFSLDGSYLANGGRMWKVSTREQMTLPYGERIIGFSNDGNAYFSIEWLMRKWAFQEWWVRLRQINTNILYQNASVERLDSDKYLYRSSFRWNNMDNWTLHPDNSKILAGPRETRSMIWDVHTGKFLSFLNDEWLNDHKFKFSVDAQYLATPAREGYIISEQQANGDYQEVFKIPGIILDVAISPNNQFVAVGDDNSTIRVYEIETQTMIFEITTPNELNSMNIVAFSPDGSLLIASSGQFILMWDFETMEFLDYFDTGSGLITDIAFSPNGHYLATISWDGIVKLWGIPPAE